MTVSILICLAITIWAITRFYLRGEDLGRFDQPGHVVRGEPHNPSAGHYEAIARLKEFSGDATSGMGKRQQLAFLRRKIDELGDLAKLEGIGIQPVDNAGVCMAAPSRWAAPGAIAPSPRACHGSPELACSWSITG